MGGQTFENTKRLEKNEYDGIIIKLEKTELKFLCPFRLGNKLDYGDVDLIVSEPDKFVNYFQLQNNIHEIKTIPLFERFNLYSKHILTNTQNQIDLLISWNSSSMEIIRAFYSYSFANIFLKKLANIVDRNLKFAYLGLYCSSKKFVIPNGIQWFQMDSNTKLITDCKYVFELLDLDYDIYKNGFSDEFELLDYFSKSKYFAQCNFKFNSGFKHDYTRLKPFANLVNSGKIIVEGFEEFEKNEQGF